MIAVGSEKKAGAMFDTVTLEEPAEMLLTDKVLKGDAAEPRLTGLLPGRTFELTAVRYANTQDTSAYRIPTAS